jgi:hypothetical protein
VVQSTSVAVRPRLRARAEEPEILRFAWSTAPLRMTNAQGEVGKERNCTYTINSQKSEINNLNC